MWSWRGRVTGTAGGELAEDAEEFLNGTMPERSGRRARRLPGWAWLSALAHGDRGVLESLACRQGDPDEAVSWARAVGFLAGEVLELAERQESLIVELQRRVVVPAELDFLDLNARGWTLAPEHLVSTVLAGLDEERRTRPAP